MTRTPTRSSAHGIAARTILAASAGLVTLALFATPGPTAFAGTPASPSAGGPDPNGKEATVVLRVYTDYV